MPSLWAIPAVLSGPVDRRAVHRRLASWLDTDHHADRKPWSWAVHNGRIEIGLLDDALAERLRARTRGVATMVSSASWQELRAARVRSSWTARFVSPVTFRRKGRSLPWPSPAAVLGSLRTSWREFATLHVPDVVADLSADPVIVTALDGRSEVEKFVLHERPDHNGVRQPVHVTVGGFRGAVTYTVDGPIAPNAVAALFALAPYAGVGAHTTRGFGGTRIQQE